MDSKITTEDCKEFLLNHFKKDGHELSIKDFKRTKKYKQDGFWHRDFLHPVFGKICLIEKDGKLEISQNTKNNDLKYFKTFSQEDTRWAKAFMKKLGKYYNEDTDDDIDAIFETPEFLEKQAALASQFTFFFPPEDYENIESNKKNGLDTLMAVESSYADSFNIMFVDKNCDDVESGTNTALRYGVLPEWLSFCDECHADCAKKLMPKELTVRGFIEILFKLGFEYKADREMGCLFEKEIKLSLFHIDKI